MEPTKRSAPGILPCEAKRACRITRGQKRSATEVAQESLKLSDDFVIAANRLRCHFSLTSKKGAVKEILVYLKNHFNERLDVHKKAALEQLKATVGLSRPKCAQLIDRFLKKDDHFAFRNLPRDLQYLIYSYLDVEDSIIAKEFHRGDLASFYEDWCNIHEVDPRDLSVMLPDNVIERIGNGIRFGKFDDSRKGNYPKNVTLNFEKLIFERVNPKGIINIINRTNAAVLSRLTLIQVTVNASLNVTIQRLTNLKSLRLCHCDLQVPTVFEDFNHLRIVQIDEKYASDSMKFSSLKNLRNLVLTGGVFPNLEGLSVLTSLTCLHVRKLAANQETIDHLNKLFSLRRLVLRGNLAGVNALSLNIHHLRVLDLSSCEVDDQLFEGLCQSQNRLTSLNLKDNELTSEGIQGIVMMTTLKRLSVAGNSVGIGTVGIQAIAALTQLTTLDISAISCDYNKNFRLFTTLTNLRQLQCRMNRIGNRDTIYFSQFPKLTFLDLSQNYIGGSVKVLQRLPHLRALFLDSNQLGEEEINLLSTWTHLESTNVANNLGEQKFPLPVFRWKRCENPRFFGGFS